MWRRFNYVALINLAVDREIIPEFLQSDCRPEALAAALAPLLKETPERAAQLEAVPPILKRLGIGGAAPGGARCGRHFGLDRQRLTPFLLKAASARPKPLPGLRGVAQLVEHRSPKPRVVGSSPSAPAIPKNVVSKQFSSKPRVQRGPNPVERVRVPPPLPFSKMSDPET